MLAENLTLADDTPLERGESRADPRTAPMLHAVLGEDDTRIHAALVAGDARGAVAAMARVHGPSLGRLCFALLANQGEADEMAQEALLSAYDAAPTYRAEGSPRAWLFGIARRLCAKRLEVRTRQLRRRDLARDASEATVMPDALVAEAHDGKVVRDALDELRPTEREAVLLRYVSELSFRDVGVACGIEEATARQRVGRAVARLRDRLSEKG